MKQTVLAVDPGLQISGFAIIQAGRPALALDHGMIRLKSDRSIGERLSELYTFFCGKIAEHKVAVICLETPFLGKNIQSFLKLGYIRGILHLIAAQNNCELIELSPRTVKKAVAGTGAASKEMVKRVVGRLLSGIDITASCTYDITDALAIGLCGVWSLSNLKKASEKTMP